MTSLKYLKTIGKRAFFADDNDTRYLLQNDSTDKKKKFSFYRFSIYGDVPVRIRPLEIPYGTKSEVIDAFLS